MNRSILAACVVVIAGLAAGCTASGTADGASPSTTDSTAATGAERVYDFYDPCDKATTAWFARRGYTHPEYLDPLLDEFGSECSYDNGRYNVALMSRPSTPGDGADALVHELLGKSGPVSAITIDDYPVKQEILTAGRARQDCHLVITVDYGFLEITGGPLGHLAPSYPRDCDAVRDFAPLLLDHMEATWAPPSGN